ncbi:hypothetical protein F5Y11DRAFT_315347 [Daldinia sp. FL1419]|nr:hypothetical protein F5Y11DRAFT_315347 [Daldinia sp. FL1419]
MPPTRSSIQHLGTLDNHFRFLFYGRHVKYITIERGIWPDGNWTFIYQVYIPTGPWNSGFVSRDRRTGRLILSFLSCVADEGVGIIWHRTRIDHLDFQWLCQIRQDVRLATHVFFHHLVILKFASFTYGLDSIENETMIYRKLQGQGIAPEFLCHITEEVRGVIGFATRFIEGSRPAERQDLTICLHALTRLHALRILHGAIERRNFLVQNGRVFLIDFAMASLCDDPEEFEDENDQLRSLLLTGDNN